MSMSMATALQTQRWRAPVDYESNTGQGSQKFSKILGVFPIAMESLEFKFGVRSMVTRYPAGGNGKVLVYLFG